MIDRKEYKLILQEFRDYALDFGLNNNDRIILIVLLCNITQELRKKDPNVQVIDVVEKLIKDEWGKALEEFLLKVCLYCEAFLMGDQVEFHDYGLKDIKDKVHEIRKIVNNFLPF